MIGKDVVEAVKTAVKKAYGSEVEPEISYPEAAFGDFATNVAFALAKELKQAPQAIAEKVASHIDDKNVAKAEAVAGFVNLKMTQAFWADQIIKIDDKFTISNSGKKQKTQIEYISANPTGPLTIGNARGGYIGDVMARILENNGYEVTREYYFNNAGNQIGKLVESVKVAAGVIKADEVQYKGAYIEELAKEFKEELASKSEEELRILLADTVVERYIKPAVKKMGINFDVWFNERDLITDGSFDAMIDRLKELDLVYEKDGALWLASHKLGDKREDRVLIKSNEAKDPTYLAPDIAYHINIFETRNFDRSYKVLGPDHIDQFPSLNAVINKLFPQKELVLIDHQWLRLIKGGKEVKVSKRTGEFVTISDLIDEVGDDVARFFTLMRARDTHMDFDWDLAKEQSQKNPFYYVMYAYTRAAAILKEAAKRGIKPTAVKDLDEQEQQIARQLLQLPELTEEIAQNYEVHKLTFWGMELAKLFHEYYEQARIVEMEPELAGAKLAFLERYLTAMQAYWKLLGIKPRERM